MTFLAYLPIEDHNGFNAGSMFFKVDPRSLQLAKKVLKFQTWPLDKRIKLAEQSALKIIFEEEELAESGQVVYMDQDFFNSYRGKGELTGSHRHSIVAMIHFPSIRKRIMLLPLLQKILTGKAPRLSPEVVQRRNENLRRAASTFWKNYRQRKGSMTDQS